jgi:hypothetical protein
MPASASIEAGIAPATRHTAGRLEVDQLEMDRLESDLKARGSGIC